MKGRKNSTMKRNQSQYNAGIQELSEEQLDQITGGRDYTVKAGDNLSTIATKKLGSDKKWHQIYQRNKDVIGNNPNLIRPGQKLEL
jgi:bacteriocin-like protein